MLDKIEIVKESGEKLSVDIISMFKANVDGVEKSYCLVTANEIDQNGLVKIHVAEILEDKLVKITQDSEWIVVKNVMRSIISSSAGDFTYINLPGPFRASDDFSRVVAVKDDAKNQLITDYRSKKPEVVLSKPTIEQTVSNDVTPSIYPKDNSSITIGSEVVPGIIEDNKNDDVTVKEEVKEEKNEEESVVETSNNEVKVDEMPTPDVPTMNEEKESAPLEEKKNEEVVPTGSLDAKEILINKITTAVEEYLASINTASKDNTEVEKLKKELDEKSKKLDSIMSLLNKA